MMDPWAFQRWAFEQQVGSPARKAVLALLAIMADSGTGRCEAKQKTLAQGTEMSVKSVGRHLVELEERGFVARRPQVRVDGGRRSDEYLLLAPWVDSWPDGTPPDRVTRGDDPPANNAEAQQTTVSAQERPLGNGHASKPANARESASSAAQKAPDDFPVALRDHARIVYRLLRSVAEQHNAREVTPRAVCLTIMGNPGRRYVEEAHALAAWAQAPPRPIKDVVGTYRTWLVRAEVHAGIEKIGEADLSGLQNVHPIRAGGGSVVQRNQEMVRRWREQG
jgi:hypothetical protein